MVVILCCILEHMATARYAGTMRLELAAPPRRNPSPDPTTTGAVGHSHGKWCGVTGVKVTYHAGLYLIVVILLFHHHHLRVRRSFDERIEDLKVHKQTHDHLNVKILEGKRFFSSVLFCTLHRRPE